MRGWKKSKGIYKWLPQTVHWKLIIKKTSAALSFSLASRPITQNQNIINVAIIICYCSWMPFPLSLNECFTSFERRTPRRTYWEEIVKVSLNLPNLTRCIGVGWLEAPGLLLSQTRSMHDGKQSLNALKGISSIFFFPVSWWLLFLPEQLADEAIGVVSSRSTKQFCGDICCGFGL